MTEGCPTEYREQQKAVWLQAWVSCCWACLRHSSSKCTRFWASSCSLSAVANCCSSFSVDWSCNHRRFSRNLAILLSTASSSSSVEVGCGCTEDAVVGEVVEVEVVVAVVPSTHQGCMLVFSNTSTSKSSERKEQSVEGGGSDSSAPLGTGGGGDGGGGGGRSSGGGADSWKAGWITSWTCCCYTSLHWWYGKAPTGNLAGGTRATTEPGGWKKRSGFISTTTGSMASCLHCLRGRLWNFLQCDSLWCSSRTLAPHLGSGHKYSTMLGSCRLRQWSSNY